MGVADQIVDMFFRGHRDSFAISRSLPVTEADAERIINRELDRRRGATRSGAASAQSAVVPSGKAV